MTTHASLLPAAKAPRSAFAKLLESETKMAWRLPLGLLGGVVIPILLVVIFGSLPGMNHPEAKFGGLTYFDVYFPIFIAISVAIIALMDLPLRLANYREQGILRRLSTTPMPRSWMLAAQVAIAVALAVAALVVIVVLGASAYSLGVPKSLGGFVLAVVVTIGSMFAIGLWVSAWARSAGAANGIGQLILFPMLFFAGLWIPLASMNHVLRDIANWTPMSACVQALQTSMLTGFPSAKSLLVPVAYAVVFGFLAVRYFRWE